jgi:hypothetical protein
MFRLSVTTIAGMILEGIQNHCISVVLPKHDVKDYCFAPVLLCHIVQDTSLILQDPSGNYICLFVHGYLCC